MFHSLSGRVKPIIFLVFGLPFFYVMSAANAGVSTVCRNFLTAQDYPRAIKEAKSLLTRKGLTSEDELSIQMCLGGANRKTGHFPEALSAYLRAESLSQSTEDLAIAYISLGATYLDIPDLDRAELYTQRAILAFKETGNTFAASTSINNLALIVKRRGDLDRAMLLFRESIDMDPDGAGESTKLNNIALIHMERKEFYEAEKLLREAIEISRRQGNGHNIALHQINLGKVLHLKGDLVDAEQALTAGLNAIQLIGDRAWEAEAYASLGMLDLDRKDSPSAKGWFKKAEQTYLAIGQSTNADVMRQKLNQIEQ